MLLWNCGCAQIVHTDWTTITRKKKWNQNPKKERREKEREAKRHKSDTQTKDETAGSSETVSDDTSEDSHSENTSTDTGDAAENIWSGPAKIIDEKSREDEFDEYFEDMFLWQHAVM